MGQISKHGLKYSCWGLGLTFTKKTEIIVNRKIYYEESEKVKFYNVKLSKLG
jgi:hypothetical protein